MTNSFLFGIGFRSKTPSFDPDQEIELMVTGKTDEGYIARVGDSILHIEDAPGGAVDTRIRARVIDFDDETHRGTARYIETIGESSF
ncbi:DUF7513 family protein [Halanaeroarchaeum sulfurireducens]|uniref:DUF7513 domain-containing protein n=1 Tax=Halanaeroarchaeum sulfurireducens TaxID=1604004 RepID=A0A0F7PAR9_9EURY|nr:hypothetical protein [Halanaeroarchaeum sulfurireducens]AKH97230.1 hypothetical protein HLASF_0734 [Halanaeroarchaeum sulfurireducens]ALG81632.1 hypothetical protein HLASA_0731 [Halanaeroarchaeum sulfurireducens]